MLILLVSVFVSYTHGGYWHEKISLGHRIPDGHDRKTAVDHRTRHGRTIITPPKRQGQSGFCGVAVAAAYIESYTAIYKKKLPVLSLQQLADCTSATSEKGSIVLELLEYAKTDGVYTEAVYGHNTFTRKNPIKNERCYADEAKNRKMAKAHHVSTVVQKINCYEKYLEYLVDEFGPVMTSMQVTDEFHDQWNELSNDPNKSERILTANGCAFIDSHINGHLNHFIILYGYGEYDDGRKYWIARNSWGDRGDHGFFNSRSKIHAIPGTPAELDVRYFTQPIPLPEKNKCPNPVLMFLGLNSVQHVCTSVYCVIKNMEIMILYSSFIISILISCNRCK